MSQMTNLGGDAYQNTTANGSLTEERREKNNYSVKIKKPESPSESNMHYYTDANQMDSSKDDKNFP